MTVASGDVSEMTESSPSSSGRSHFENIQSSNWNSLRFKPPPSPDSEIGFRVEFRSLDIQMTDYENAALSVLVTLLVRVIGRYDVNFIIPVSKVDDNLRRAGERDAYLN